MICDDAAARIHLVGGEMLEWSDTEQDVSCGVGVLGELLRPLLPSGARVLVAGPHPVALLDDPAVGACELSVLLRSHSDACHLARRPDLTVYCGSLEKAAFPEAFDVVIALDGVGRLTSFDRAGGSWTESLQLLAAMLAPGGTLVLGVENPLGLHRFAADPSEVHRRADDDWAAAELDQSRPANPERLADLLNACGLTTGRSYAAYGHPARPHLLLEVAALETASVPATLVATACAGAFGTPPPGYDARHLIRTAMAGGLGARIAPRWVTTAHAAGGRLATMPVALSADADTAACWRLPCELAPAAEGGWIRRARGDRTLRVSGRVTRTPGLLDGPIPEGRSLTEILMAACARNDVVEIREILGLFQRWMDGHGADGKVPGWAAFAVADNVVFDGTRFMMLDASWQLPGELDAEVVLARILRRFAVRLLDSGQWHPWSWQLGADRLTLTLLSMAGGTADPEDVRRGAELDAQIDTDLGISPERGPRDCGDAGQGPDQDDLDGTGAGRSGPDQGSLGRDDPARGAASLEENDPDAPDPVRGGPRESYRELYAARGRLRERLEEAQQKITMLERDLEVAEAKLTKLAKAVRAAKQAGRRDDKSRTPAGKRGKGALNTPMAILRPVRRIFGAGSGRSARR